MDPLATTLMVLDYAAVAVFGATGALAAARRKHDIITFGFFDLVNAVKITLPRPRAQGGVGETDMHAAQQHVPLQEIRVPWEAP